MSEDEDSMLNKQRFEHGRRVSDGQGKGVLPNLEAMQTALEGGGTGAGVERQLPPVDHPAEVDIRRSISRWSAALVRLISATPPARLRRAQPIRHHHTSKLNRTVVTIAPRPTGDGETVPHLEYTRSMRTASAPSQGANERGEEREGARGRRVRQRTVGGTKDNSTDAASYR